MLKKSLCVLVLLLSGCTVEHTRTVYVTEAPLSLQHYHYSGPVTSVYVEPALVQPEPIKIAWAPPPMLVDFPPPAPYAEAVWTGGYWAWEGNWIWDSGRWAPPPQPGYQWTHPYYEHRNNSVVFIDGFWAAPGVKFVAPSVNLNISLAIISPGIRAGLRPIGPEGVFVPAPPGSRAGLIVPAPIGTSPAVVTGASPIVNVGMRVTNNTTNNTIVNNRTTTVTNITNVIIIAPASATANGQAMNTVVPAQAHLAAAMKPVINTQAPVQVSSHAIPGYVVGHQPVIFSQAGSQITAPAQPSAARKPPNGLGSTVQIRPMDSENPQQKMPAKQDLHRMVLSNNHEEQVQMQPKNFTPHPLTESLDKAQHYVDKPQDRQRILMGKEEQAQRKNILEKEEKNKVEHKKEGEVEHQR